MISVCPHLGGGIPARSNGGGGGSPARSDGGYLSQVRTEEGGMTLAFTQEDFLVSVNSFNRVLSFIFL